MKMHANSKGHHSPANGLFAKGASMGSPLFHKGALPLPSFSQIKQGLAVAKTAIDIGKTLAPLVL
jgi:hypothetical protein